MAQRIGNPLKLVFALGVLTAGVAADQTQSAGGLRPCQVPSLQVVTTLCMTIPVPENRTLKGGRTLSISVVVVPPDSAGPELEPIVPIPGGPGGGTIAAGGAWARTLKAARAHRALILHDPRGTPSSEPLECDFSDGPSRPGSYIHDFAPPDKVKACAALLSTRADLTQYHTDAIAADLAEILTALGYQRANLYGVSGGTRQAFIFAQRYPGRVRTLTLGGVVPPGFKMPIPYARDFERSLDLLARDCARDPACHAAYPDVRRELAAVAERLTRSPARVPVRTRTTPDTAIVTRGLFLDEIRHMLYSQSQAARVPYVIHQAARGDFAPFVDPQVPPPGGILPSDGIPMGHFLAVTCSEDIDRIGAAERQAAAQGTLLGDYRVQQQVDACKLFPHARLPQSHFAFKPLGIPTLLLSGDADPVTPPRWAEAMRRYLPRARHVVFPTGGHVPTGTPCGADLASRFIQAGDAGGLDFSCAASLRRPPFLLP
jgi:pimeloyl-ACP methyl ester carboxylesterase